MSAFKKTISLQIKMIRGGNGHKYSSVIDYAILSSHIISFQICSQFG